MYDADTNRTCRKACCRTPQEAGLPTQQTCSQGSLQCNKYVIKHVSRMLMHRHQPKTGHSGKAQSASQVPLPSTFSSTDCIAPSVVRHQRKYALVTIYRND